VCLYDVAGIGTPYQVFLPAKKAVVLTRLNPPLPIECFVVEGKTVSDTAIAGRITDLGENSAEIFLDQKVPLDSNLRVILAGDETRGLSEWYAKVFSHDKPENPASEHRVRLQFTSMPQDTGEFLEKRRSDG
jgi:hypothetical protein